MRDRDIGHAVVTLAAPPRGHRHTRTVYSTTEPSRVECVDCGAPIDSVTEQRQTGRASRWGGGK